MQELEKILEEIEKQKSCCLMIGYAKEYNQGALKMAEVIEDIIRKHMDNNNLCEKCSRKKWYQIGYKDGKNDGWIPVEERMPERTPDEKINNSYKKYLVFIDNIDYWDIDIAVYDLWNDKKWRNLVIRIARLKMLQLGALFQIHTRKYRRKINDKGNS